MDRNDRLFCSNKDYNFIHSLNSPSFPDVRTKIHRNHIYNTDPRNVNSPEQIIHFLVQIVALHVLDKSKKNI